MRLRVRVLYMQVFEQRVFQQLGDIAYCTCVSSK